MLAAGMKMRAQDQRVLLKACNEDASSQAPQLAQLKSEFYCTRIVYLVSKVYVLAVRTKMRTLDRRVLLEACVENATSKLLQLAQVKFETAPDIKAIPVHNSASLSRDMEDLKQPDIWLESYADSLQVCNFSHAAASAHLAPQQ